MIKRVDKAVDLTEELKKDVCGLRRGEAEPTCIKDKHTSYRQKGVFNWIKPIISLYPFKCQYSHANRK